MNSYAENSKAASAGTWLGHAWLRILRREKQFAAFLAQKGVPTTLARASIWIINLSALALTLYYFLPIGLVVAGLLLVAQGLSLSDISVHDKKKAQWRDGLLGFGLYTHDGFRIDPHDPNDVY